MKSVIRHTVSDVDSRLAELGLVAELLRQPVMQGILARTECTPNDPPLTAGFTAWSRTVRCLREGLILQPYGWHRSDEDSYSLVVSPDGKLAIAVATGDENTGNPDITPLTKSPKGPNTQRAVEVNQSQGLLFDVLTELEASENPHSDRVTWILLQHYDQALKEVRFELSLPNSYSGKIDGWSERIIFGAIPLDPAQDIPVPILPSLPDIDVPLRRRA